MKILVACEESQEVCKAFRARGHEAYSADIKDCSGGHPEWHIKGDVTLQLKKRWDMVIAFPPCTYLTKAGACNIPKDPSRIDKGWEAREFFMMFYNLDVKYLAIENPVPMARFNLPKHTQIIQPYYFGHQANKQTLLWLKNLPPLYNTNYVGVDKAKKKISKKTGRLYYESEFIGRNSNKNHSEKRSKTFRGVAEAMAEQWGDPAKFDVQLTFF